MDNITTGFPNVNQSITNPNVNSDEALDKFTPYTFLQFIETVSESYKPETLTAFYNNYLNKWNTRNAGLNTSNSVSIIDRYRDFLKDITLNFSTNAEKKFLTQLDFTDQYDLQIAMSFFSSKIRNIVSYYKKKRNTLHYSLTKSKIKGSSIGVEQAAKDLIIDFLENRSTGNIDYNISDLKNNLSVSITEYYDNFSQYFNRTPNVDEYGSNYKGYEPDGLPEGDNLFLSLESNLVNKIFASVSQDIRTLKEADSVLDSKKKQTQKFMGSDFYYLSTDSNGTPDVGLLFKADKPYANFLNQDYPSTASIFSDDIISERDLGFFRSHNSAIATIQGKRIDFYQKNAYKPNQLYIFPDPNLFTNNQQILTFIVDTTGSINNRSKGMAINQPNADKESTTFIGYTSELQKERNLNTDLSYLYDQGYIDESKKDIFGNIFGLVKDNDYYRENLTTESVKNIKSLVLNGYQFFDDLYSEGFNFNYSTSDSSTFSETIRSGLTAFTNGLSAVGDQSPDLPLSSYYIFGRFYSPYQDLKQPTNYLQVDYARPESITYNADVLEGAYFRFSDSEALADPIKSGLSAFTASADQFYFSDLIDAGIGYYDGGLTVVRALCDNTGPGSKYKPGISLYEGFSGNFTYNVRLSGSNGVKNYDGSRFTDNIEFNYSPAEESFDYKDDVFNVTSFTTVDSNKEELFNRNKHLGKIYIKNINKGPTTPSVKELTDTLDYLSGKYNNSICHELSTKVVDFDIIYNTLFVETSSFLVTERTIYEDNEFVSPNTFTNTLNINTNFYDKVSNRLRVGSNVFFVKMERDQLSYKNNRLYPRIYKYSYADDKTEQIFPTTGNSAASSSCFFDLSTFDSVYIECGKPNLTYSSDNEQFNLAVLVKDQNKAPLLVNYLFEYKDDINFLDSTSFDSNNSRFTDIFYNSTTGLLDTSNSNFVLQSQTPVISAIFTSASSAALIL
tara:strand:+ start:2196 stop:5066 length:2871 start_codon:yes stop_codon:yes gene_type:complete